jgi:hypothetical protein
MVLHGQREHFALDDLKLSENNTKKQNDHPLEPQNV